MPSGGGRPAPLPTGAVMCEDSLSRSMLEAAACGALRRDSAGLGYVPVLGRHGGLPAERRSGALAREAHIGALPPGAAGGIDAEAVAAWIVGHYPAPSYPAVLLGSPHGGAVHLATALGAAWLPTTFTITVRWPGGAVGDWPGAMEWGAAVAGRLLAANPTVSVRQVHDPVLRGPLSGTTVTLHVRWRTLPAAYLAFLRTRLDPGGASVLLRDLRTWPVRELAPGHDFQLGSPSGAPSPEDLTMANTGFRRLLAGLGEDRWPRTPPGTPSQYAELSGDPGLGTQLREVAAETGRHAYRVLYSTPETLSACVADLYRTHLLAAGQPADRCVVTTDRLLDPWRALAAGVVPYWCESASRRAVDAAEWWLAGSDPFAGVTVVPQPPGTAGDTHAGLTQWRSVAAFGRKHAILDRHASRRYPLLPLPTSHAARAQADAAVERPAPLMRLPQVLGALRRSGAVLGLLVG